MDADADDDITGEVEISIVPRQMKLDELGIAPEAFDAALVIALEGLEALAARNDLNEDYMPPIEVMRLVIGGVTFKLEELAEVEVSGWDD
jgi:hypothetical protein